MEPEASATQQRPAPALPSIYTLPLYILPKDGVNVYVNFPMSGKLWPLVHSTFFYSSSS
jgi:hypothetical protein